MVLTALVGLPGTAAAQDARVAEVRGALEGTLDAWRSGDFESFAGYYHPSAQGFFLDGGARVETFDVAALQAAWEAGFRTELELRDIEISLYGETAVSSAYLDGSLTLPGGGSVPGTWRYTETRIPVDGTWTVVQYHFSQQQQSPMGGGS